MAAPATFRTIQMLRALAVLLVALFHLDVYLDWLSPYEARYFRPFAYSGVDLFFIISGFINYHVSIARRGDWRAALLFLYHRAVRILPNYWIILSLSALLVAYGDMHPAPEQIRPLESYLLLYPLRLVEYLLLPGWTLTYEWYFYLALAVLLIFPRALWWVVAAYALASIAAQNELEHWNTTRLWEFAFAPYFLQFIAGMVVAELLHRLPQPPLGKTMLAMGAGFFCLAWYLQTAIYPETFANPWHRDLRATVYLFAYAPMLYGVVALEKHGGRPPAGSLLVHLGDASFSLYLLFMPWFHGCYLLWGWLVGNYGSVWMAVFCFAPLTFLSYLLAGSVWYRYIERPLITWLKQRPRLRLW